MEWDSWLRMCRARPSLPEITVGRYQDHPVARARWELVHVVGAVARLEARLAHPKVGHKEKRAIRAELPQRRREAATADRKLAEVSTYRHTGARPEERRGGSLGRTFWGTPCRAVASVSAVRPVALPRTP